MANQSRPQTVKTHSADVEVPPGPIEGIVAIILSVAAISIAVEATVTVANYLKIAPAPPFDDVVGFITVNGYSKPQELALFALALILAVVSAVFTYAAFRDSLRMFARESANQGSAVCLLAAAPFLVAPAVLWARLLSGTLFHPFGELWTIAMVTASLVTFGWCVRWTRRLRPTLDLEAFLAFPYIRSIAPPTVRRGGVISTYVDGASLTTLAAGLIFVAWTMEAGSHALSQDVFFSTILASAAAFILSRASRGRIDPRRAIESAFAPLTFLVALTFTDPGEIRFVVVALVDVLIVATLLGARRPATLLSFIRWTRWPRFAFALASLAAANIIAGNPLYHHGEYVPPLDGDGGMSWLFDAMHGRAPYRDYWYPYGPLSLGSEVVLTKMFGLDEVVLRYSIAAAIFAGLGAVLVCRLLRMRPISTLIGEPFIVLLPVRIEPRFWVAVVALGCALWAINRRSRAGLLGAGAAVAISVLFSAEAGFAAGVAVLVTVALYYFASGYDFERARRTIGLLVLGGGLVSLIGVLVGSLTGTLVPYLSSQLQIARVLDSCCGSPFPNLFEMARYAPAQGAKWLFHNATFLGYYVTPMVYIGTLASIVIWIAVAGRLRRRYIDIVAFSTFGVILFRSALGRSDSWHVTYVALPAIVLLALLIDGVVRAFTAAIMLRTRRFSLPRIALSVASLALCISILATGNYLGDFKIAATGTVINYKQVLLANAGPGDLTRAAIFKEIDDPHGDRLFFDKPIVPEIQATTAYLRLHATAGDDVFTFPFGSRYDLLTGRLDIDRVGPQLWGAAVTREDRLSVVRVLAEHPPKYAVYSEGDAPDVDNVPWSDRFPEIFDFIFSRYRVVSHFGNALIFEYDPPYGPTPPPAIEVADPLTQQFLPRGWYYPSGTAPNQTRWTTRFATVRLTRLPDARLVRIVLAPRQPDGMQHILSVSVQGVEIAQQQLEPSESWLTIDLPLPPGPPGQVKIEISIDRPFLTGDYRWLGVEVKSIALMH